MLAGATRGLALFLGAFTLMNFAAPDANLWWIDFWPLPLPLQWLMLALLGVVLLAYAYRARSTPLAQFVLSLAFAFAIVNTIRYYVILGRGEIRTALPVPLALLIAAALAVILAAHRRPSPTSRGAFAAAFLAAAMFFPLAQITLFGLTDYRRQADVIVVFGARVYTSGALSPTLRDRVRTGIELFEEQRAPRILFSGGPGEGRVDEPEAMRRYALRRGVPDSAIVKDPRGVNTEATVRNTLALVGPKRILVVSDFWHLPRIKMTFQRYGVDVYTVPADAAGQYSLPWNIGRESVAFWVYYLRRFTRP